MIKCKNPYTGEMFELKVKISKYPDNGRLALILTEPSEFSPNDPDAEEMYTVLSVNTDYAPFLAENEILIPNKDGNEELVSKLLENGVLEKTEHIDLPLNFHVLNGYNVNLELTDGKYFK